MTELKKDPVVVAATQVLAHVPGMARHGSKPSRELPRDPAVEAEFLGSLRSFDEAVAYPAHQAFVGAIHPRALPARPWTDTPPGQASRWAPRGEVMPEEEFLGLLASVDTAGLLTLGADLAERALGALGDHPLAKHFALGQLERATGDVEAAADGVAACPIHVGSGPMEASLRAGDDVDQSLTGAVLLENLAAKATATLALLHLLDKEQIDPASVDYVIGCGEEAVGDRYQRGGGNLAKAVAEAAGLSEASGMDVKDFCAAPIPALVVAASLVKAGVFRRVAVVAGGSLAKLGMKFQGHLRNGLPVLEDVLGGAAALVEGDDGASPTLRLDAVGRHRVAAGGSAPQIMESLAMEPLVRLGLTTTDIDDFATELHNPEITEPQGSGNVPERNYKTLAALAARRGDISRDEIASFVESRGMPGFAPTQGHLASGLCYLPHALDRLKSGDATRSMIIAKGSLFLGRMSQLSDGMSVVLERNRQ
ncbi:MAG: glycine/sarcosine/betaine reductase complex component C subunit beta [Actinomycetota bacterium]|nr:glycine/sarcosine/betaine reductase complex component C subunit beta [Actinomycetota bacterium]